MNQNRKKGNKADDTGMGGKETLLGGHVKESSLDRLGKIFRLRTWNSKCENVDESK